MLSEGGLAARLSNLDLSFSNVESLLKTNVGAGRDTGGSASAFVTDKAIDEVTDEALDEACELKDS